MKLEIKLKYNLIKAASLFCNLRNFNEKFVKEKLKNYYFYRKEGFLEIKREITKKCPKFLVFNFLRIAIFRLGNKKYLPKIGGAHIINRRCRLLFIFSIGFYVFVLHA